ncbi:recombinase family protein [Labrys neptuniae]
MKLHPALGLIWRLVGKDADRLCARVSKADGTQLLVLGGDALISASVDSHRIYEDRVSRRKDDRPASCLLEGPATRQYFVIWKLDRLERDPMHLVTIIDELRERNMGLRVQARRSTRQRRMADWSLASCIPRRVRARADRRTGLEHVVQCKGFAKATAQYAADRAKAGLHDLSRDRTVLARIVECISFQCVISGIRYEPEAF